jgi:hypothetical protein
MGLVALQLSLSGDLRSIKAQFANWHKKISGNRGEPRLPDNRGWLVDYSAIDRTLDRDVTFLH